jgi:hypothetical protein
MRRLAMLVIAMAGIAVAAPAVAQAPRVNITIGKPGPGEEGNTTTVQYGGRVELSGEITSGQFGEDVQITISPYRGTPTTRTVGTDSGGDFSFVHRPVMRTSYSARYGGTASEQEPIAHVAPRVGLRVRSARRGQFSTTVAAHPAHVSRLLLFQRRVSGSDWATVKRVRLRAGRLGARFSARLPAGRLHRVRMFIPQTPGYLRATSRFVLVRGYGR